MITGIVVAIAEVLVVVAVVVVVVVVVVVEHCKVMPQSFINISKVLLMYRSLSFSGHNVPARKFGRPQ